MTKFLQVSLDKVINIDHIVSVERKCYSGSGFEAPYEELNILTIHSDPESPITQFTSRMPYEKFMKLVGAEKLTDERANCEHIKCKSCNR